MKVVFMSRILRKSWDIIVAFALAALSARLLPPNTLRDVTSELITFFAIQSAVTLPAMIFTAGMLRPDGITVSELKRYLTALRMQMHFWTVLLVLDLIASALIVIGKASDWRLAIYLPWIEWHRDVSWVYLFLLMFTGALAALRIIPFVKGIMSLLELNGELTEKAIMMRVREKLEVTERNATHTPLQPPGDYGRIVARR